MDLELLQQCYMVEVDHKQLYPAITTFRDEYHIQYDLGDNHIMFVVTYENIYNRLYLSGIKRKVVEWVDESYQM